MSGNLTTVLISYRKNRLNHRLLFGQPEIRIRRGWRREILGFLPGQTFGYERWQANKFGTQYWRIAICLTTNQGPATRFPGIAPGVILLFDALGKQSAKRALAMLDELKTCSPAGLVSIPTHEWRMYANDLRLGVQSDVRGGAR